jgi:hypothetical protein
MALVAHKGPENGRAPNLIYRPLLGRRWGRSPIAVPSGAYFGSSQDDTNFQTLNTVAGTTYTIQFALDNEQDPDPADGYINDFSATFGGTTLFSETNAPEDSETLLTFTSVATGTSTNLTFTSQNDALYWDLDSVNVAAVASPVPEPGSLMLLGTGVRRFCRSRPPAF